MSYKYKKKRLPKESVERFFKHCLDHTLLVLRYEWESDSHTVYVKEGNLWTFNEFWSSQPDVEFEHEEKSFEDALRSGLTYLQGKLPSQFPRGLDDDEPSE